MGIAEGNEKIKGIVGVAHNNEQRRFPVAQGTAKLFSAVKDVSVDFDPLAADVNGYINAGMVSTQADRGWPTAFQPEFEAALPDYLLNKAELPDILNSLDKAWDTAKAASQS